jgi:hypothetical protein
VYIHYDGEISKIILNQNLVPLTMGFVD